MKWNKIADASVAALGGLFSLIGGWTIPLNVLVIFVVLDYITGLAVAFSGKSTKTSQGGISSEIGLRGIMKKAGIVVVIMVAAQLEKLLGFTHNAISQMVVCMFIANEGISILENTSILGVLQIPFLNKVLEQLKTQNPKLGQILIEKGDLTEAQLKSALKEQEKQNDKNIKEATQ